MMEFIKENIKNVLGWRTKRKIVVFSVDDYGNVRLASPTARRKLDEAGLKIQNRFDALDSLENREDLEQLFDALTSVKDKNNRNAVFTPFSMSCNIDFDTMKAENYQRYVPELLTTTFQKVSAEDPKQYEGTWSLVKQGIESRIFIPQYHGREHLNLKVFEEKLKKRDAELITCLENKSYTSISNSGYTSISYTAAFDFDDVKENDKLQEIAQDGLACFEKVYGYKSVHFNAPGGRESSIIHKCLLDKGIKYIDAPWIKREHTGHGKYKTIIYHTGKKNKLGQLIIVRNVVFEPTDNRGFDWVNHTLRQIDVAFSWNKPAVISSHRVNFCGHIDPANRSNGISALRILLKEIVKRWPDVEFREAHELGRLIA
ncbi:hypothetical protein [Chryseotalea sanaruensis]|nr:hypothetical protein [Chryseotalea sanaruensis]